MQARVVARARTEPITVVVRGPHATPELAALTAQIDRLPGIASGAPFQTASPNVAYANFTPRADAIADPSGLSLATKASDGGAGYGDKFAGPLKVD